MRRTLCFLLFVLGASTLSEQQRSQILDLVFGADGLKPGLVKMFPDPYQEGLTESDKGKFDHKTTTQRFVRGRDLDPARLEELRARRARGLLEAAGGAEPVRGRMTLHAAGVASMSMVLLIIASGGAFKQVLLDAGTGEAIKAVAAQVRISPRLGAWCVAALLRLAVGRPRRAACCFCT